VNEEDNDLIDNGDSAQGADRNEELKVAVEHWYV
jgi:hypothetical protein